MNTNLVTNQNLSERLKKLGVPQKSYASWCRDLTFGDQKNFGKRAFEREFDVVPNDMVPEDMAYEVICSAFLSGELMELLPKEIIGDEGMRFDLNIYSNKKGGFEICYWWDEDSRHSSNMSFSTYVSSEKNSFADICGELLCDLIENKIIDVATLKI